MSWRSTLRDAAKDVPPVVVLVAVGFLDGVDGAAGLAIAFGAYAVALIVWTVVWNAYARSADRP